MQFAHKSYNTVAENFEKSNNFNRMIDSDFKLIQFFVHVSSAELKISNRNMNESTCAF